MSQYGWTGFIHNKDVHMETARKIFGPNATKDDRKRAKSVNFGIMYGMGADKLAQDFKMTRDEAEAFIDRYKAALPTLFAGMSSTQQDARKNRYCIHPIRSTKKAINIYQLN